MSTRLAKTDPREALRALSVRELRVLAQRAGIRGSDIPGMLKEELVEAVLLGPPEIIDIPWRSVAVAFLAACLFLTVLFGIKRHIYVQKVMEEIAVYECRQCEGVDLFNCRNTVLARCNKGAHFED